MGGFRTRIARIYSGNTESNINAWRVGVLNTDYTDIFWVGTRKALLMRDVWGFEHGLRGYFLVGTRKALLMRGVWGFEHGLHRLHRYFLGGDVESFVNAWRVGVMNTDCTDYTDFLGGEDELRMDGDVVGRVGGDMAICCSR